jgi:hypothetical protein
MLLIRLECMVRKLRKSVEAQLVASIRKSTLTCMFERGERIAIVQLPPTWENVYVNVLANWNAMARCMDNWSKLDDPDQVKAYAAILKRLTDPANFEGFLFMPVTRDMSSGERALLYNFLDSSPMKALF